MAAKENFLRPVSQTVKSASNDSPTMLLYSKMEKIISQMMNENGGVSIKTVKSLLTKIPDVFSGEDVVNWLMHNLDIPDEDEAIHLGSLIAAHGYFFPIDDHVITLKNDNSFYRFQAQRFWPSNGWDPDNTEYAIYLCKRTMQNKARLELADYEAENLARLQKSFANSWETIFHRAEQEAKNDRKRDKTERKVADSQERAFWDVYRPVPGCVNTFEIDIKKSYWNKDKNKKILYDSSPKKPSERPKETVPVETVESLSLLISNLTRQMDRHCLKMSKVCDSLILFTDQQAEYDPMMTAVEPSNPWLSNDDQFWLDSKKKDVTPKRASKWKYSFGELLKDEQGCQEFRKFLEKEVSAENLDFYLACKFLKIMPLKKVKSNVQTIFDNFLSEDAPNPINIDSKIKDTTVKNMENPNRYCFEEAQEHIYRLMKTDSYARFLKSDHYQCFLDSNSQKLPHKSKLLYGSNYPLLNESSG